MNGTVLSNAKTNRVWCEELQPALLWVLQAQTPLALAPSILKFLKSESTSIVQQCEVDVSALQRLLQLILDLVRSSWMHTLAPLYSFQEIQVSRVLHGSFLYTQAYVNALESVLLTVSVQLDAVSKSLAYLEHMALRLGIDGPEKMLLDLLRCMLKCCHLGHAPPPLAAILDRLRLSDAIESSGTKRRRITDSFESETMASSNGSTLVDDFFRYPFPLKKVCM
ncbi:MAG: hypothetical protein SGCHY_003150 [Lobulomycetales sp.]